MMDFDGKVTKEDKFPCTVCRKGVGSNSTLCQFCRCRVHKRCSCVRGKLKDDSFKCQTLVNQQTGIAEYCPGIELNDESLGILKKFCYFCNTIRAGGGAFDSAITRRRGGCCKLSDLVPLLTSIGLPLKPKGRLYFACVRSVMLYGSETWPAK